MQVNSMYNTTKPVEINYPQVRNWASEQAVVYIFKLRPLTNYSSKNFLISAWTNASSVEFDPPPAFWKENISGRALFQWLEE